MKRHFLRCLSIFLLSALVSCGSNKIDYTKIKPEYQQEIEFGVDFNLKMKQQEPEECDHNYEAYGIQGPNIYQYNDETHQVSCPICWEVLEYIPHSEKYQTGSSMVAVLKDGTPCYAVYSICECRELYKAVLYRGDGNER